MHRARGLWRAGVAATLGGSRAISGCPGAGLGPEAEADPALLRASSPEVARRLRGLALVRGGFVSEEEAVELLREVEPGLGRGRGSGGSGSRRSEGGRGGLWWGASQKVTGAGPGVILRSKVRVHPPLCPPQAITGYRETERGLRGGAGRALLLRVTPAFPPRRPPRPSAHVLDLLPGGRVGPHVDSVKFCGCTIAGVSLLSPSVLRLRSLQDPQDWLELLLEPGSLYVLRAAARYEFTHEILPDEESFFGGLRVPRGRRVALIFRNDPSETPPDPLSDLPVFIEDTQDSPPPK
ncbi:alpha-ketoglutarate-dependent dioxygenase alkB homolog 7, mitochondrial [Cyanocitta cristata]